MHRSSHSLRHPLYHRSKFPDASYPSRTHRHWKCLHCRIRSRSRDCLNLSWLCRVARLAHQIDCQTISMVGAEVERLGLASSSRKSKLDFLLSSYQLLVHSGGDSEFDPWRRESCQIDSWLGSLLGVQSRSLSIRSHTHYYRHCRSSCQSAPIPSLLFISGSLLGLDLNLEPADGQAAGEGKWPLSQTYLIRCYLSLRCCCHRHPFSPSPPHPDRKNTCEGR